MLSEEDFKYKYLQQPITFLTEENLDKLETHCRKAIRYERGVEHRVVLELLERYEEFLAEREQDKKRIKELEETNKKYIVQLTDEQYRNLVETIRKEAKKEYEQRIKDKIEKLKDTAKRIAGTYQYADSGDDLLEKKNRVIELRNKAEALENFLGG